MRRELKDKPRSIEEGRRIRLNLMRRELKDDGRGDGDADGSGE